ncbi:MAG: copper homeostasis protein CutC [bacterium]|nr:copper homeostasis protein CutC [bacterium]
MKNSVLFEICIDSPDGAVAAQEGGAKRVELCDNLIEGGTTPSAGAIRVARRYIDIGLQVIIRPRGGDFCYTALEFEAMKYDVERAGEEGADGVVIGVLTPEGAVDVERTGELVALAGSLSVTFHRAFDMVRDAEAALEDLILLGIHRVLTSGCEASALEGVDLIAHLVQKAGDRIVVMPGGGIHERNVGKVVRSTGVKEVHVSARGTVESRMEYRNPNAFMGGELRPPEFTYKTTDADRIRSFIAAAQ